MVPSTVEKATSVDKVNSVMPGEMIHTKTAMPTEPVEREQKETSWVEGYNRLNTSMSVFVNAARAYYSYRESEKKILGGFEKTVEQLVGSYTDNLHTRIEDSIGREMEKLKALQLTTSAATLAAGVAAVRQEEREGDLPRFIQQQTAVRQEEREGDLPRFIQQQTAVLGQCLAGSVSELNAALQQNVAQFQKEMASASNTLLPPLTAPAKNDLASLYQSLRQFVSEGCGKKEKDWFPYPQLYPPGTLLHLRNNPTIGKQDDYALMEAVADRCQGKRPSARFGSAGDEKKGVEMVEVDKEEFDHYSLDVSLIEDHRMGNYVWGLCKYYDSLKRDA